MRSSSFGFWELSYNWKCVDIETLRNIVVKTEDNPFGEITPEEFTMITHEEY